MGIGVGKVNEFKLQITVGEKKVESGTTEGLTIKSEPEETRGKPDLPLHSIPPRGLGIVCGKPLSIFISTFS